MTCTDARSKAGDQFAYSEGADALTACHLESKFATAASPLATTLGRSFQLSRRGADRVFISAYSNSSARGAADAFVALE
jgi:hypothetical protein